MLFGNLPVPSPGARERHGAVEVVGGREGARESRRAGRKGVRSSSTLHSQGECDRRLLCLVQQGMAEAARQEAGTCDSIPGEAGGQRDARAEGAECRMDRVSQGDTHPREPHQGSWSSPTQLCSCTPDLGQSPVCKGQHCPSTALPRCSPSPTMGAAPWAEQTAPGSHSPLFSLKGQLQPSAPAWLGRNSSLLSGVSFKHHMVFGL